MIHYTMDPTIFSTPAAPGQNWELSLAILQPMQTSNLEGEGRGKHVCYNYNYIG